MGELPNRHFYDFGFSGRVPDPQNQICLSFEPPGYRNKIKNEYQTPLKTLFYEFPNLGTNLCQLWRRRAPEMIKIRLIKYWKSLIQDKYLSKKHEMGTW